MLAILAVCNLFKMSYTSCLKRMNEIGRAILNMIKILALKDLALQHVHDSFKKSALDQRK